MAARPAATHQRWTLAPDCVAGVSQAGYAANLATVIASIRAVYPSGPIFINHETWDAGTPCPSTVGAAQDAAVNHAANIWAGGNWDTINNTGRYDNTRLNASGAASATSLLQTAMHAYGVPF